MYLSCITAKSSAFETRIINLPIRVELIKMRDFFQLRKHDCKRKGGGYLKGERTVTFMHKMIEGGE